ncbi:hypothetical protein EIP86_011248 [Pleurotus ostreatoroseus]|nr:hypothetical protein EIP86_011248 [Pleurotus ostreatoroseus]
MHRLPRVVLRTPRRVQLGAKTRWLQSSAARAQEAAGDDQRAPPLRAHTGPFPARTHHAGILSAQHAGQPVVLTGWLLPPRLPLFYPYAYARACGADPRDRSKLGKGFLFFPLRDPHGTVQLVVDARTLDPATVAAMRDTPPESTVCVRGTVRERPEGQKRPVRVVRFVHFAHFTRLEMLDAALCPSTCLRHPRSAPSLAVVPNHRPARSFTRSTRPSRVRALFHSGLSFVHSPIPSYIARCTLAPPAFSSHRSRLHSYSRSEFRILVLFLHPSLHPRSPCGPNIHADADHPPSSLPQTPAGDVELAVSAFLLLNPADRALPFAPSDERNLRTRTDAARRASPASPPFRLETDTQIEIKTEIIRVHAPIALDEPKCRRPPSQAALPSASSSSLS